VVFVGATGDAPTPWLAHRGDRSPLGDPAGRSVRRRLAVVTEIAAAFDNVETGNGRHWGLTPDDVVLVDPGVAIPDTARADVGEFAAVGNWGLRRAVRDAAGEPVPVSPYDAPEQVAPERFEVPSTIAAYVAETDAVDTAIDLEQRHAVSKPWIDAYRVGAVAYEVLTGRPPFPADDPETLATTILAEDPAPPSEVAPELPSEVDPVVAALLERDPSDRPMAGWVTEELEELFEAAG
jgi:serine/threonine protein kinase